MTAECYHIHGEKIEVEGFFGDPEVIAQCEWLLERAKSGEITAIVAAVRDHGGLGTFQRGSWRGGFFESVGALQVLLNDMCSGRLTEDDD